VGAFIVFDFVVLLKLVEQILDKRIIFTGYSDFVGRIWLLAKDGKHWIC
jgi:hypothetical protein